MTFEEFQRKFQRIEVEEVDNCVAAEIMVSVCIQTYNQENYISQCLESILSQKTSFKIEILIGEDSSSDNTREICIEYAKKYPDKIRLFLHHRANNILVQGRNTGLFNSFFNVFSSKGKYIAYCDGDDYWTDELKLEKQVSFLENNANYSLCYHDVSTIDENGEKIFKTYFEEVKRDFNSEDLKRVLVQPPISTWCFRNIINEIPFEMTQTINADNFWISLLGFHGAGKYLNSIKPSFYRIHSKGIWSLIDREAQIISKRRTYELLSKFYQERDDKELSDFFKNRSLKFLKMLIFGRIKKLNFQYVLINIPKYLRLKYQKSQI
ncbi:glycosyltransferase [Christiangramia sediminis]|uniref:Glycosyltransferase n=1 Tax=Christiangramia sediminis TaxID=2881336 RepID=A0A9X1LHW7_9FLAO|nr:glycosyltransferase [Christiangramia sediminis]MCB7480608.1 glycosyltransferase [Christiangramia sediminis]